MTQTARAGSTWLDPGSSSSVSPSANCSSRGYRDPGPSPVTIRPAGYSVGEPPDERPDVVLHMRNGDTLTIDPVKWEVARGELLQLPERTE